MSRVSALVVLALMLAGAASSCGSASRAGSQPHGGGQASAAPTAGGSGASGQIQLVPPTVRPLDSGSSGLPAPSGVTASRVAPPIRILIPTIGVDSGIVELDQRPDGTIEVPADWNTPGWYARGPAPGEPGPAVILGHLDSFTGPAVFWRLSSLQAGDAVQIDRKDGTHLTFSVSRTATFNVDSFPTSDVYGPSSGPELRLITCGGSYSLSRHQYLSNVVAFARLSG
ncbi:MAG: class F sortase [Candidatus Nephthysia bennettiae]|uniref:Class F sortase n=1 Tax=Candidatus Nephthysia bennettiae TaxID=3127016 RepID=A0A934K8B7_9BACT|nr:class F sortase [Candidatus Dormibacteraeota bacterium]MBJ7610989.1 class F sortase [Candidatus Dormibacteraeota bacterium]PZR94790.1 MAG: class F sortase [Candidatus Dormibacteraeota bacterium]